MTTSRSVNATARASSTSPCSTNSSPAKNADFYLCGPKPFMEGAHRQIRAWGVDDSQFHQEFFGPKAELA